MTFRNKWMLFAAILGGAGGAWLWAQEPRTPVFRSKVDLVVLSFTVTDSKGRYINGLKPTDFRILEDGIPEKISTFAEGSRPATQVSEEGAARTLDGSVSERPAKPAVDPLSDAFVGTNVFVLFDTSNFMYRGFRARPGPVGFSGRVHFQPQRLARRNALAGTQRRHHGAAQGGRG